MDEQAVIQRAKAGCHEAFSQLFETYYRPVVSQCMSIVGDPMEAEDVAQDVFLDAYLGLGSFRGEAKLSTWLYRMTANKAYRRMRQLGKQSLTRDDSAEPTVNETSPGPIHSEVAADPEQSYMLRQLMGILPPLLKRTVHLRLMGYKYTEIARMYNCPPETVKTRVRRAIFLMREEGARDV